MHTHTHNQGSCFFLGSAFVAATKLLHPLVLAGTKELTRINVEMQIKSHQQLDIIQSLMKSWWERRAYLCDPAL